MFFFLPFFLLFRPSAVVVLHRGIKMIFMRRWSSAFDNFIMDFSELYIIDGVEKASRVNTGRKCIDATTMVIESF